MGNCRTFLQEALARRRPDFLSQSRQRLRRLALQVEARKLQEVLSRRREERYGRPGGAARQLQPAGTARSRGEKAPRNSNQSWIYDIRRHQESCSQEGDDPEVQTVRTLTV